MREEIVIAFRYLLQADQNRLRPVAHGADGADQRLLRALQAGEQHADFIAAIHLNRRRQIAGGDAFKVAADLVQRLHQHGTQPPHGAAGHHDQHQDRPSQHQARQREGELVGVSGFADVAVDQLQVLHEVGFEQVTGFLRRLIHKRLQLPFSGKPISSRSVPRSRS